MEKLRGMTDCSAWLCRGARMPYKPPQFRTLRETRVHGCSPAAHPRVRADASCGRDARVRWRARQWLGQLGRPTPRTRQSAARAARLAGCGGPVACAVSGPVCPRQLFDVRHRGRAGPRRLGNDDAGRDRVSCPEPPAARGLRGACRAAAQAARGELLGGYRRGGRLRRSPAAGRVGRLDFRAARPACRIIRPGSGRSARATGCSGSRLGHTSFSRDGVLRHGAPLQADGGRRAVARRRDGVERGAGRAVAGAAFRTADRGLVAAGGRNRRRHEPAPAGRSRRGRAAPPATARRRERRGLLCGEDSRPHGHVHRLRAHATTATRRSMDASEGADRGRCHRGCIRGAAASPRPVARAAVRRAAAPRTRVRAVRVRGDLDRGRPLCVSGHARAGCGRRCGLRYVAESLGRRRRDGDPRHARRRFDPAGARVARLARTQRPRTGHQWRHARHPQ